MKRTTALLAACAALSACGGGGSSASGPASGASAASGAAAGPWTVASEAGLWRHVVTTDGQPGPAELVCYVPSMGSLADAPPPGLRCEPGRPTDTPDGYVVARRCTAADGRAQEVRSTVTGDLASAFNVSTGLPGGGTSVSTWMRMGGCPDGMSPGQRRPDGLVLAPPPPPPEAAPRRASSSPSSGVSTADPIGDVLNAPEGSSPAEAPPSEGAAPPAQPVAPAEAPQPAASASADGKE